jgi:hypothetical protein
MNILTRRTKRLAKIILGIFGVFFASLFFAISIYMICGEIDYEKNIFDLTSQMEKEESAELETQLKDLSRLKRTNFFLAYHTEAFEVNDEYIDNVKAAFDKNIGKSDVLYVYMKDTKTVQKVVEGKVSDLGTVSSDEELTNLLILDMAKSSNSDGYMFNNAINILSIICFAILGLAFALKAFKLLEKDKIVEPVN